MDTEFQNQRRSARTRRGRAAVHEPQVESLPDRLQIVGEQMTIGPRLEAAA